MREMDHSLDVLSKPLDFSPSVWIKIPGETVKYRVRTKYDRSGSEHPAYTGSSTSGDMHDPYCLETDYALSRHFADSSIWVNPKTNSLYDLAALNLVTTRNIVAAVTQIERSHFESWINFYSRFDVSECDIVHWEDGLEFSHFSSGVQYVPIFQNIKLSQIPRWIIYDSR